MAIDPASDHWKLVSSAYRYLFAADALRQSQDYDSSPVLFVPTLHLIAHGLELLLKGNLVGKGAELDDLRRQFGHDLFRLWNEPSNDSLKSEATKHARVSWNHARNSGDWSDSFESDPTEALHEYVATLSRLHSRESKFALRYVSPPNERAPRAPFLLDAFLPVAHMAAFNPSALND